MDKLKPVLYLWLDAVKDAVKDDTLRPRARLVAEELADHMKTEYLECYPGLKRLCDRTGYTRPTVLAGIKDLEDAGFLIHKPGGYKPKNFPNKYLGLFPMGGSKDFELGVVKALDEGSKASELGVDKKLYQGRQAALHELLIELPRELPKQEKNLTDFVGPAEWTKVAWNLEALLRAAELQFFDSLSAASPAFRKCQRETTLAQHGQSQRIKAARAAGIELLAEAA